MQKNNETIFKRVTFFEQIQQKQQKIYLKHSMKVLLSFDIMKFLLKTPVITVNKLIILYIGIINILNISEIIK